MNSKLRLISRPKTADIKIVKKFWRDFDFKKVKREEWLSALVVFIFLIPITLILIKAATSDDNPTVEARAPKESGARSPASQNRVRIEKMDESVPDKNIPCVSTAREIFIVRNRVCYFEKIDKTCQKTRQAVEISKCNF